MDKDEIFILKAIALGKESMDQDTGGPFGAIVVMDGKIAGEGKNEVTSQNDPTAHAEVNAIRNACKNLHTYSLEGATLYTSCEPCPMCLGAIYWARIQRIVFASTREDAAKIAGFDDDHFYEEINTPWENRKIDYTELSRKEGQQLFQIWKAKANKKMY